MKIEHNSVLTEEEFVEINRRGAPLTKTFRNNVKMVRIMVGAVGLFTLSMGIFEKNWVYAVPFLVTGVIFWFYPQILMNQMTKNTKRKLGDNFKKLLALRFSFDDSGFQVSAAESQEDASASEGEKKEPNPFSYDKVAAYYPFEKDGIILLKADQYLPLNFQEFTDDERAQIEQVFQERGLLQK